MFKKLKDAIDGALSALEGRTDATEDVERLLGQMRKELIEAKAALPRLEQGVERLRRMQAEERKRAEDCVRRASQARDIGDTETLRLAVEYGERHRERARVYGEKIRAAEAELSMQRRAVDEMTSQFKSAMTHRDALKIRSRRSSTSDALRAGGHTAAARFDRMAEDIEDEAARAEATRELDVELGHGTTDGPLGAMPGGAPRDLDAEALAELQLEELKRRMADEA